MLNPCLAGMYYTIQLLFTFRNLYIAMSVLGVNELHHGHLFLTQITTELTFSFTTKIRSNYSYFVSICASKHTCFHRNISLHSQIFCNLLDVSLNKFFCSYMSSYSGRFLQGDFYHGAHHSYRIHTFGSDMYLYYTIWEFFDKVVSSDQGYN